MLTILSAVSALGLVYLSSYGYSFLRNYYNARKSGLPYIIVPWDQNSFFWMIASVPLQPFLQRVLPKTIYDRIALAIYGHEFREKTGPYSTARSNKPTLVLVTPGRYEIQTRDPEIATEILRRPRDFVCHELTSLFMNRFGHNVLTSDGDAWSRQRKIVASTINEKISKVVFEESIKQTEGLIDEVVGEKNSGETSGMFDMMKKIAINVLSGASMGSSVDWNNNANGEPKPGYKLTYINAVKVVIDAVAGPIILPKWVLDYYPSSLPGHKFLHDLSHAIEEFPIHTRHLLEEERQRSAAGGESRGSIMSQMLAASETEIKGAQGLTDEEQIGNLFIFTAAGFDTTANTLAFSLVLLARYPEWQEWLHDEISNIVPEDDAAELNYATTFPKATRVLACMLETLRLYSPLVHISRQTNVAQTIKTSDGTTYHFPAKSTVYVNLPALHLDPNIWRNINLAEGEQASEDDESRFRPTRWIVHTEDGTQSLFQPPRGSYAPWSGGPRVCPGMKMAQVEYVGIFLRLFRRFRMEAVPLHSESRQDVESRLEGKLKNAGPILVLQMKDIFEVGDGHDGVRLKLCRRA